MITEYKYHYTYLITNLNPTDTLQFYIGVKSCNCHPEENTKYLGSSPLLEEDIKLYGTGNFEKIIIAEFDSRDEAEIHENALHISHNAAANPIFYNRKNGTIGFHSTPESIRNRKETMNDPKWKAVRGKEQSRKHKETVANPIWLEITGNKVSQKHKATVNDPEWKATKGKEVTRKHKETVNNTQWKKTIGREQSRKHKETVANPEWKATKGKEAIRKQLVTKADPDYIKANTFVCPYCRRSIKGKGNFNKWHGDKCQTAVLQKS